MVWGFSRIGFIIGFVSVAGVAFAECKIEEIDSCIEADPAAAKRVLDDALKAKEDPAVHAKFGNFYRRAPAPFRNPAAARFSYEQAAAAGDGWSMLSLADMLLKGEGGAADTDRALELIEKARAAGLEGPALSALAKYQNSTGDLAAARSSYEQAAAAGDGWSMLSLADMLLKGEGGAADTERALELIEKARATGLEGPALSALARYQRGAGDLAAARSSYEQAAAAGDGWSMLSLADMLLKGEGGAADTDRALELIEKARATGLEGPALSVLAKYQNSAGDVAAAQSSYEQAAAAGDGWSMLSLADMLLKGEGGPADTERALELIEEARAAGLEGPALSALAKYQRGTGAGAAARFSYEQAAAAGDGWSMLSLADMLLKGEGGAADTERGLELIEEARAAGLEGPALSALAKYQRSTGDLSAARSSYEQAAAAGDGWSILTLADMLLRGEGGAADTKGGLELIEQARAAGLEESAPYEFGKLYRQLGGQAGAARARSYFELAYSDGENWGGLALADMLMKGEGGAANTAEAEQILKNLKDNEFEAAYAPLANFLSKRYTNFNSLHDLLDVLAGAYAHNPQIGLAVVSGLEPNAKAATIQYFLAKSGEYTGALNGLLTSETLRAIARYCRKREIPVCRNEAMPVDLFISILKDAAAEMVPS